MRSAQHVSVQRRHPTQIQHIESGKYLLLISLLNAIECY